MQTSKATDKLKKAMISKLALYIKKAHIQEFEKLIEQGIQDLKKYEERKNRKEAEPLESGMLSVQEKLKMIRAQRMEKQASVGI